ncbi:MAG: hypothetical protein SNJ69_13725 [Chloroflexaceae bacterium]
MERLFAGCLPGPIAGGWPWNGPGTGPFPVIVAQSRADEGTSMRRDGAMVIEDLSAPEAGSGAGKLCFRYNLQD